MLTSHELFGFMSPAMANDIITFTFENEKPTYRATLNAVAEARHVRGVFLERQPKAQRHATMASALAKPNLEMAAEQSHPHLVAQKSIRACSSIF